MNIPSWTEKEEERFNELALKEALETIDDSELHELRILNAKRKCSQFNKPWNGKADDL